MSRDELDDGRLDLAVITASGAAAPVVPTALIFPGGGPIRHSAITARAATISAGMPSLTARRLDIPEPPPQPEHEPYR